jgi:peptidyl-prolyl cis-trans isomerase A (cyclophilin A)
MTFNLQLLLSSGRQYNTVLPVSAAGTQYTAQFSIYPLSGISNTSYFKMSILSLSPLYAILLLIGYQLANANEHVSVVFRNELPNPITLYWDGQDNTRIPQNGGLPLTEKGGELRIGSFAGHRFSYDYGGERHYLVTPAAEQELYLVLLAGENEISVQCTVTSNSRKDSDLPLKIRVVPWWSPRGASRFLQLVRSGYYNGVALNRVVPHFLTQFGINPDYQTRTQYRGDRINDDPVRDPPLPFAPGAMAFAGSGPDSRTTEVFIVATGTSQHQLEHFGANPWETPFAVVDDVANTPVANWHSYGDMPPYGEGPASSKIYLEDGYEYLARDFPLMDYIQECSVVEIGVDSMVAEEEL